MTKEKKFNQQDAISQGIDNIDVRYKVKEKGAWNNFLSILKTIPLPIILILISIITGLLTSYFSLLFPEYQQNLFTEDVNTKVIVKGVLIIVMTGTFLVTSAWINAYTSAEISYRMRNTVWDKILKLPVNYFDKNNSKELISRVSTDTASLSSLFVTDISILISSTYAFIVSLMKIGQYHKSLVLVSICAIPVQFLVKFIHGKVNFHVRDKLQFRLARITEYMAEMLSSIPLIKSFAKEKEETEQGNLAIKAYNKTYFAFSFFSSFFISLESSVTVVVEILVIYIGGKLVAGGNLELPKWIAFYLYSKVIIDNVNSFARFWTNIKETQGSLNRVGSLLLEEEESTEGKPISKNETKEDIVFDNVSFCYNSELVLKNINLTIPKGKVTAIVGKSGSGKTTILNLIERFYKVTEGEIRINNQNIDLFNLKAWRDRISYVAQQTSLYSSTLRENILYGVKNSENISDKRILQTLECVGLTKFSNDVSKLDTFIEEAGESLSGGERQKIAIARAMLNDSDILLLDEVTANLDAESMNNVKCSIDDFAKNITQIIVTHNLYTVLTADKIVVIKDGQIVGEGTHHELIKDNKYYKNLVQTELSFENSKEEQ